MVVSPQKVMVVWFEWWAGETTTEKHPAHPLNYAPT